MARLAMVKYRDFEAIAMVNQIKTIPLYRRKIRGLLQFLKRKQVKPGFTTYQPQPNNSRALSKMKKKQQKTLKNNKTNISLINLQKEP